MRSIVTASLLGALALGGCGGSSVEEGTDTTSRDLLASVGEGGQVERGQTSPQTPAIEVALLGYDHGERTAPVRVLEMSDFGCSWCRRFHQDTWPMIHEKFVESGKVEWKFLPFVNGMFRNSMSALRAAECVLEQDSELFLGMSDRIWSEQGAWKGSDQPDLLLRGWADEAGADMARFDSCLGENRRSQRIEAANALARQLGVRGTPTFFIIGYQPIQGALPAEDFENILNLVYADATQRGGND